MMWTDEKITQKLKDQRDKNIFNRWGRGGGCPFTEEPSSSSVWCRENICKYTCDILFPQWAKKRNKKEKDYQVYGAGTGIEHPCYGLTKKYVLSRCNKFIKQHYKEN